MKYKTLDDIVISKDIMQLISDNGGEARLVGGCVRDILLRKEAQDIDLATNLSPLQVMKLLKNNNIKCIATGLKHGTVTAIIDNEVIEITTLRRDVKCDGRHAITEFTDDWQEDAARRDFTFNALYCDIDGKIYDYFGGQADLQNRRLRFVGDIEKRICEDYLRILRAFRFHAQICCIALDQDILEGCRQHAHQIKTLSSERITHEMLRLLQFKSAIKSLMLMQKSNVLSEVMPWDLNLDSIHNIEFLSQDPIVNLAVILRANNLQDNLKIIFSKWRLSKKYYKRLYQLCNIEISVVASEQLSHVYHFGQVIYLQILLIYYHEKRISYECMVSYHDIALCAKEIRCPINGDDLIKIGYKKGKYLGDCLREVVQYWERNNYLHNKDDLIKYAESLNKNTL